MTLVGITIVFFISSPLISTTLSIFKIVLIFPPLPPFVKFLQSWYTLRTMIKHFLRHLWESRVEFSRYFIIGVSAFTLDVGSLYLLKEYFHFSPTIAVVINQPIIINLVFFLNKHWSFKAGGLTHQQVVRFYLLALINYLISVGWIHMFHSWFGVNYLVSRMTNIILSVGWNFLLYKHWVYKVKIPNN